MLLDRERRGGRRRVRAHRAAGADHRARIAPTSPGSAGPSRSPARAAAGSRRDVGGRNSLTPAMSCPVGSWIQIATATDAESAATKMPNGKIPTGWVWTRKIPCSRPRREQLADRPVVVASCTRQGHRTRPNGLAMQVYDATAPARRASRRTRPSTRAPSGNSRLRQPRSDHTSHQQTLGTPVLPSESDSAADLARAERGPRLGTRRTPGKAARSSPSRHTARRLRPVDRRDRVSSHRRIVRPSSRERRPQHRRWAAIRLRFVRPGDDHPHRDA